MEITAKRRNRRLKCPHVSAGGPPLSLGDGTVLPIMDSARDPGVAITLDFKTSPPNAPVEFCSKGAEDVLP